MKKILMMDTDAYWVQQIFQVMQSQPNYPIELSTSMLDLMNRINSGANVYSAIVINYSVVGQGALHQLVQNIRAKAPFVRIIFVLDGNDPYKIVEINQIGGCGLLIKPYSPDALISEIEKDGGYPNQMQQNQYPQMGGFVNGMPQNQSQMQGYPRNNGQPIGQTGMSSPDNMTINNLSEMGVPQNQPMQSQNHYGNQMNGVQGMPINGPQGQMGMPMGNRNMPPQGMSMNGVHGQMGMPMGGPQNQMGVRGVRIAKNTTLSVHCPKGGVGKSSISKELAAIYASSKFNGTPLKVCLVDADIDYGDVAVMLELKQNKSIADWARNIRQRINQYGEGKITYSFDEVDKFYLLTHKSGLRVLAAPTNYRDSALINEQVMRVVIENLKNMFDVVIIDTGNNTKDFTVVSMEMSDKIIMVGNLDVSTINEILMLRKTLEQIQFPMEKIGLLMNEVKKGDEANTEEVSKFLGLPLIGKLPRISAIEQANNAGDAMSFTRENPFTIELKRIANGFVPVVAKPNIAALNGGKGQRKSIFSKIFNK